MEKSIFEKIRKGEQGMYDPTKRYAFTNPTEDVFKFQWNGVEVEVASKETIELPQYLAVLATTKIIDQMMTEVERKKTEKIREVQPAYIAPNGAGMLGIPAARLPYEKMVIRELAPKTGSDAKLDIIRMKEQVEADIKRSKSEIQPIESVTATVSKGDFSELNERPPVTIA